MDREIEVQREYNRLMDELLNEIGLSQDANKILDRMRVIEIMQESMKRIKKINGQVPTLSR